VYCVGLLARRQRARPPQALRATLVPVQVRSDRQGPRARLSARTSGARCRRAEPRVLPGTVRCPTAADTTTPTASCTAFQVPRCDCDAPPIERRHRRDVAIVQPLPKSHDRQTYTPSLAPVHGPSDAPNEHVPGVAISPRGRSGRARAPQRGDEVNEEERRKYEEGNGDIAHDAFNAVSLRSAAKIPPALLSRREESAPAIPALHDPP
jgi:hypothetical protein